MYLHFLIDHRHYSIFEDTLPDHKTRVDDTLPCQV